ncbi:MAG: hypothetical protein Q9174_004151 [Haloplaca sp. 1 TL-2023]
MAKSTSKEGTPTIPATVEKTTPSSSEKKGKTSAISLEDQLKFTMECIRFGNIGKVDFEAVASACGIVSKGAAAKRWERLLKSYNVTPAAQISPRDASVASAKRTKPATPAKNTKAAAEKKRKQIEGENPNNDSEDSEDPSPLANKKKRVKFEKKERKDSTKGVKVEDISAHSSEPTRKLSDPELISCARFALQALGADVPITIEDHETVQKAAKDLKIEDDELAINDPDFMAEELANLSPLRAPSAKTNQEQDSVMTDKEEERDIIEV